MLYKNIFDIINEYLYNIKIINEKIFMFKCSQCREFYHTHKLKETNEQSWGPYRIYCPKCRKMFRSSFMFTYKEFK